MAGALDNIGARFGDIGASGLSLAGQWVPLEGSEAAAGAAAEDAGLGACAPDRFGSAGFGTPGPGISGPARSGCAEGQSRGDDGRTSCSVRARSRCIWARRRGRTAPPPSGLGRCGRRGAGATSGPSRAGASRGFRYDGELRTGWLGMDARAGRLGGGARGEPRHGRGGLFLLRRRPVGPGPAGDGADVALPLRALDAGRRAGAARSGRARAGARRATSSTAGRRRPAISRCAWRRWGSGGRCPTLPASRWRCGRTAASRGSRPMTARTPSTGSAPKAGACGPGWRRRGASRWKGETSFEPFLEAAVRQDGGDGLEGSGVELAGGLRYHAPGVVGGGARGAGSRRTARTARKRRA